MRNIVLLFLVSIGLCIQAQNVTVNVEGTVKDAIVLLKETTGYSFVYETGDLDSSKKVSIFVKDRPIEEVLSQIFAGQDVDYRIVDKNVIVTKKRSDSSSFETKKEETVSGIITDETGEPLIGASVLEAGTLNGTVTDIDGNYELKLTGNSSVLKFSFLGYKTQEIELKGRRRLDVKMSEDIQTLEEVVVTALGIKREKKMLGYSVQELSSDKLTTTGDPSVASALQGKVAGMQLSTAGTGLSGSTKITIRGNSSLTDNNQPLWIVDGVPFNDNNNSGASFYGGVDRGGASVDINPDDIETISVLKGPNAAALYGSRAGNGVILVTTKKGVKNKGFGVTYNGSFTWNNVSEMIDRQHTYGQGSNGIYDKGSIFSFGPKLDNSEVEAWNGEIIPYSDYSRSFSKYFNTGFAHNHNVSVGNVTDKSHFRAAFGASDNSGLFQGETLRKFNVDLNAGMKFNNYLSMDGKVSLSNTNAKNRPVFGAYGEAYQFMLIPNNVRLQDLKEYKTANKMHVNWTGPTTDYLNPYYVNKQYQNSDDRWRAFGYYNLKINFTDWLYLNGKYAFDYHRTRLFDSNIANGTKSLSITDVKEDAMSRGEENFFEQNAEIMLIGDNRLGSMFRLGYMVGANFMNQKYESLSVGVRDMVYKNNWMLNAANVLNTASENGYERATNSVFASLQFAFNEYLSLDLTARNDWSSTLPKKNNSFFYPSANLSFVITDLVRSLHKSLPSWLTFTKVRASVAQVGKDTDPYKLYNTYTYKFENGILIPNKSDIKMNENLKPEISTSYEAGLDMKFFNNRLGFDFTYYYSETKNQIMKIPAAAPWSGGEMINAGLIVNQGVECMIYATPVKTKDFIFELTLNLAHNNSVVKELADVKTELAFDGDINFPVTVGARKGGRLGEIYAKKLYQRDEKGNLIIGTDGLPKVHGGADAAQHLWNNPIGCIQPDLLMSLTPTFTYKGFMLSAMFDMKFGGQVVSVAEAVTTSLGISKRTETRGDIVVPGVTEAGVENATKVDAEIYYKSIGGRSNAMAEEFVYDASFIKLKELSFGYSFPKKWIEKIYLSSLRLSFVARNVGYLLKYTPGTSPETGYDTSMFSQAVDFSSVPYSRTLGFSVNIGF